MPLRAGGCRLGCYTTWAKVLAARTMGTKAALRSGIELDGVSEPHTFCECDIELDGLCVPHTLLGIRASLPPKSYAEIKDGTFVAPELTV